MTAGAVMTNNYFKVHHYIPIMDLRLDVRTLLFFFDDTNRGSAEQALTAAQACRFTIGSLTYGREMQLSVFRRLDEHPEIPEIGTGIVRMVKPAA